MWRWKLFFFFSSRRRHTRLTCDWSSDVCSSDLRVLENAAAAVSAPGMSVDYAGESRQIRREGGTLTLTLGFAVILIYLVLAAQFRSFRDPLIVLLGSVPLAISGALIFTFLNLTTLNIYSQVGLITLVG